MGVPSESRVYVKSATNVEVYLYSHVYKYRLLSPVFLAGLVGATHSSAKIFPVKQDPSGLWAI